MFNDRHLCLCCFLIFSHAFVLSSMEGQSFVIKTEADSNDICECSYDVKPTTGIFIHIYYQILSSSTVVFACVQSLSLSLDYCAGRFQSSLTPA